MPPRVVIAPDKFKGTLTAIDAADAMAAAVRERWPDAVITAIPMADGGDGTLDALGGANRRDTVTGPLGRPVEAGWRLDGDLAVIESAAASGLVLAGGADANDAWFATSRGVGELLALALDAGASRVFVGMGGSAMTDGGRGAIAALCARVPFAPGRVVVLTDTTVVYTDAARVFGPQKGADSSLVDRLTARLHEDAEWLAARFGRDVRGVVRTGAAGGLSGALFAAGAGLVDGAALVADVLGLDAVLATADLVITGEGAFDATSRAGKGPGHVLTAAAARGVSAVVVAGVVEDDAVAAGAVVGGAVGTPVVAADTGGAAAFSLVDTVGIERAWRDSATAVRLTTARALASIDA